MHDPDAEKLDREIKWIADELPGTRAGKFLRWLRRRSSRWIRIPAAILLIVGGLVSFLPIFGFWMLPLGALLLALDVPFLRGPILQAFAAMKRIWVNWKRKFAQKQN